MAYVAVGALFAAAYYVVPAPAGVADWVPRLGFYGVVSLSAAVAVAVGVRVHRPARARAWLLIAGSQLVYLSADLCFYTYHDVLHDDRYPAPADVLYLAHYPFLIAGLVLAAGRLRERSIAVDTFVVGTSAALLSWVTLIDPYASGLSLVNVVSLTYPVMDLMVLVVAVRLFVSRSVLSPSLGLLAAALAMLLFSDAAYAWMQVSGTYSGAGNYLDATWMSYYLLLGAAALHPSMRTLGDRRSAEGQVRLSVPRTILLAGTSLVAPLLILVQRVLGEHVDVVPSAVASLILFILVVVRLRDANVGQERANAALAAAKAERERLLARVVEVAEQERMRVAINLHDGPIQNLTAVALLTELLTARAAGADLEAVARHAESIRAQVATEMASLRKLMVELRPPVLDERGLPAALANCAETVLGDEVEFSLAANGSVEAAPALENALYRIAREAFVNVRKHATASTVEVSICRTDDAIELDIADDGCGFDATRPETRTEHYGLASMRELAGSVGGSFALTSAPAAGTRIRVVVPLESWLPERALADAA